MSDIKRELKKLIPLYCSELDTLEVYMYADYEFSDKYIRNKEKLIKQQSRVYYPLIKTTGRRIISAIIAAALIGSITVAAYEPARDTVREIFNDIFYVEPKTKTYKYTFSKVENGNYANGHLLVLPEETTIYIRFENAAPASAVVTVFSASNDNDTYGSFKIPKNAGTELNYSTTLPPGSYRFWVGASDGDGKYTSGSFWVEVYL